MKVLGFVAVLVVGAVASTAMASADITSKSDAKSLSATIYVPDNYIKIQWAIDNATVGDTIIVRDGTYTENVDVNKRLTIQSENGSAHTIVQTVNSSDHVFEVTANYVNISGFKVNGPTGYKTADKAGIYLYYVDYCNMSNNYCRSNRDGIKFSYSNNNSIINNICPSNNGYGIHIWSSNNNSISSNDCSHNHHGIGLADSNQNSISNNTCSHNSYETCMSSFPFICFRGGYGISLDDSNNNSISNNTCSYNYYDSNIYLEDSNNNSISSNDCSRSMYGICFERSSNNKLKGNIMLNKGIDISGYSLSHYKHEIDESNTMNGKPVYYWKDVNGGRVPDGAGQVILVNCTNVVIENQNIHRTSFGIEVAFSSNITIKSNTCSYNYDGISLKYSNNNSIFNNTCVHADISIEYSNNSRISNNTCSYDYYGISFEYSNNNSISNNTCPYNRYGIHFEHSSNNSASNNTCSNSRYEYIGDCVGIYICDGSNNNSISNNTCSNNRNDGIDIWRSSNNSIFDNNCSNNKYDGISLHHSTSNSISNNTCSNNRYDGISFSGSNENNIYCNSFINNADNVDSSESTNLWNSTEEITYTYNGTTYTNYLGNYWDDYTGVDANNDGIWDHSRSIDSDQDYHPLVAPFENYFSHQVQRGDLNDDGQLTAADAAIALQVVVSGEHNNNADVNGDGRVTSLDVLMILQAAAEVIVL